MPIWVRAVGGERDAKAAVFLCLLLDAYMNYELAEQLRDAGFPQTGEGRRIGSPSALAW